MIHDSYGQFICKEQIVQTAVVTLIISSVFFVCKTVYSFVKQRLSKATVVVIGAGPVGLVSALVSSKSRCATQILIFEDSSQHDLIERLQQVAFDEDNVAFLKKLGVDFDNIEGLWQGNSFLTRLGVFEEYLLGMVYRLPSKVHVDIRLNTQVSQFHIY